MQYKLKEIDRLCFAGKNGEQYTGGSQEWYERRWHRNSGCGPVAAANLIWYLARFLSEIHEQDIVLPVK